VRRRPAIFQRGSTRQPLPGGVHMSKSGWQKSAGVHGSRDPAAATAHISIQCCPARAGPGQHNTSPRSATLDVPPPRPSSATVTKARCHAEPRPSVETRRRCSAPRGGRLSSNESKAPREKAPGREGPGSSVRGPLQPAVPKISTDTPASVPAPLELGRRPPGGARCQSGSARDRWSVDRRTASLSEPTTAALKPGW
jgi:hypothetical protein